MDIEPLLIETHAHLDDLRFSEDLDAVIERAHGAGVKRIITIGTGIESSHAALDIAGRYPSVYAAVGIHPAYVNEEKEGWLNELRSLAQHPKVVALGEIGLDYYHLPADRSEAALEHWKEEQKNAFRKQLDLAAELGFNVVIHQRDLPTSTKNELFSASFDFNAWQDILHTLESYHGKVRGVFHCFGGSIEEARKVTALGHLVSFTGIVTFKNAPVVRETAKAIGSTHYMLETDAPYLAPAPYRGERCEPAHVRLVAEKIAEIKNISLEEVAVATTATAEQFFCF